MYQFFLNIIYIMKLEAFVNKFLTNKWVLNIVALLAFLNVIGYLVMGNINTVLYFIVLAVLVRYFSKNMTIVLGVPLIFINLLAIRGNTMEGMENNTPENTTSSESQATSNNIKPKSEEQKKIDKLVSNNKNKPDAKTSQGLSMIPVDFDGSDNIDTTDNVDTTDNAAQNTNGEQQGFEVGRRKTRNYQIDYATTVEDAYDELNSILGSEGIQRLTSDTQNLMKQQMQLTKAMEGMGPVIKEIAPMVESLKGMMGQIDYGK
jgi:hypothetical protein